MAIIENCPGFETFGADVKAARKAQKITQRELAEKLHIAVRYLADIENVGKIPDSLWSAISILTQYRMKANRESVSAIS